MYPVIHTPLWYKHTHYSAIWFSVPMSHSCRMLQLSEHVFCSCSVTGRSSKLQFHSESMRLRITLFMYHGNVMVSEGNIHVKSVHMTFSGIPLCYHVHTVLLLYFNEVCATFEIKFAFAPTGVSLPLKTLPKPMQPTQVEKHFLMFKRKKFYQ